MRSAMNLACAVVLGSILAGPAVAQHNGGLTLEQAKAIARKQNPLLQRARTAIQATRGEKLQAEALEDPVLVWDFDEVEGFDPSGFGEQKIGLSQFLEFPGKRTLRSEIGEDRIAIAEARLGLLEALVDRRVAEEYWGLARDIAAIEILKDLQALLNQMGEIVRARYGANETPYSDVVRTQLERARLENERLALRREVADRTIRLNLLLGHPGDAPLRPADTLAFRPLERTLDEIASTRTAASRTLDAARLGVERHRKGLQLARMTNLPDFEFGAFYQRLAGEESGSFLAGEIAINLPLWRTRQRGTVTLAEAELQLARVELAAIEHRVRADVARAYQDVELALEQVGVFRERILVETENALGAAIDAYQVGAVDGLELIDLYRTTRDVRLEFLTALHAYLTARARLDSSGEIPGLDMEGDE